jgi:hypothetical protein
LEKKETKGVNCPFCGAPYRNFIPADVLQLKCDYCGATFRTPPRIGVEIPQCFNHPQRFAVGICNDCGQNFCRECLQTFEFKTQNSNTFLYLCPNCIRKRYVEKANGFILSGLLFALIAAVAAVIFAPLGILFMIVAIVEVLYGFSRRREAGEEYPLVESERVEEAGATEAEPEPEASDAERVYDELLTSYVDKWGVQTGMQLLETEIRAYTRHGDTFAEAVEKVYRRQEKKR